MEDAGLEVRDEIDYWYDANPIFAAFYDSLSDEQKTSLHRSAGASHLSWLYGSGFPKSLDVSKAIDAAAGVDREVVGRTENARPNRNGKLSNALSQAQTIGGAITFPSTDAAKQWNGWGTALKPAHEPIVLARKPLIGTVAENVLAHGTGGLNVDGCRIDGTKPLRVPIESAARNNPILHTKNAAGGSETSDIGRWPANVIHDGSDEVVNCFPSTDSIGHYPASRGHGGTSTDGHAGQFGLPERHIDSGNAGRFFYCAKASQDDREEGLEDTELRQRDESRKEGNPGGDNPRNRGLAKRGNHHPTVKPTDLMRYLVRLITPPGGTVLDPFAGSGSTGKACALEGFKAILIERELEYAEIAKRRSRLKQKRLF